MSPPRGRHPSRNARPQGHRDRTHGPHRWTRSPPCPKREADHAAVEHIEAIEKRLLSAADTLRANSNYASNEYFMPVMGLLFLRHAYSRFLGVKDQIEASS